MFSRTSLPINSTRCTRTTQTIRLQEIIIKQGRPNTEEAPFDWWQIPAKVTCACAYAQKRTDNDGINSFPQRPHTLFLRVILSFEPNPICPSACIVAKASVLHQFDVFDQLLSDVQGFRRSLSYGCSMMLFLAMQNGSWGQSTMSNSLVNRLFRLIALTNGAGDFRWPKLQGSPKRRALGCEKFQPGPAWVVLSKTGPPLSGAL